MVLPAGPWSIWWHGSGPERGDHIMRGPGEIAYLPASDGTDGMHAAAERIVYEHNCEVTRLTALSTPDDYRSGMHAAECYDEHCPGCAPPATAVREDADQLFDSIVEVATHMERYDDPRLKGSEALGTLSEADYRLRSGLQKELHLLRDRFRKLASAPPPAPVRDESGWLIELGSSEPCAPQYWAGHSDPERTSSWTANHLEAIRFARKDDAEKTARRMMKGTDVRICEHEWNASAPPTPSLTIAHDQVRAIWMMIAWRLERHSGISQNDIRSAFDNPQRWLEHSGTWIPPDEPPAPSGWRSISEAPKLEPVLVHYTDGSIYIARQYFGNRPGWFREGGGPLGVPAGWMPLPPPPQEPSE